MSAATPPGLVVVPLPVPADLDAPEAWLLRGLVDCANETLLDSWGVPDDSRTAGETLGGLHHQEYDLKLRFVALDRPVDEGPADPARVLGYLAMNLPRQDNTHTGFCRLDVRPAHRRRGIGTALHGRAVAEARAHGRSMLMSNTDQAVEPPAGDDTLAPPTGSGRVRTSDAAVRFALRHGWQLEQVARRSVLDVPLDPAVLDRHRAEAQQAAGPDYRAVTWTGRCPDVWVDQFAWLQSRMSTDTPMGGLDMREDVWDAARVRTAEQAFAERGMTCRVAAAEHAPTGRLTAFTALVSRADTDEYVMQDDTLVLREHRGHRLGMLVKAANLQVLATAQPGTRRIGTWNAEENAHMLAINVALGFRPAGGSGEWQLRLT
ncbi:MAG TPA: GNAT family N-acetyltransferase [Cellulomonas sp.]